MVADAGVIADRPSTSSATEEFGLERDQHTSLSRYVASVWNNLRSSRSLSDVDIQFQTTEYRDEMTMDSLIEGNNYTNCSAGPSAISVSWLIIVIKFY